MSDAQPAIAMDELSCGYRGSVVLNDVTATIPAGRMTCILGPSGCGKSTLLRTLILLQPPLGGRLHYQGEELSAPTRSERTALQHRFGVLFQGAALFNGLDLAANVAFPLEEVAGLPPSDAEEIAFTKLSAVGLAPFARHLPSQVSGGMRKRCGIARALALDPPFLFLDEPGAGLDPVTAAALDELVKDLQHELDVTVVSVTHELASIRRTADHVLMLGDGGLIAAGPLAEVEASEIPAVCRFFDARPDERRHESTTLRSRLLPPGGPGR